MTHQGGQVDHAGILDSASGDGENVATRSLDELAFGHDPSAPTQGLHRVLLFVTVLCSLAALALMSGQDPHEPTALEWLPTPLTILVLGDRSAKPQGCSACFDYVDQSAAAWSQRGRRRVRIDHMTEASDMAAPSMQTFVDMLRSNPDIRKAVSEADVILLAMGSGDVIPVAAASCRAESQAPCPKVTDAHFRQSLTSWITETDTIRRHRPVMLRIITPLPTSGLPRESDIARSACQVAAAHAAACVNVYDQARTDELVVDPGSDPQHPQLTQHGHDIVAAQLIATGITP